MNTIIIIIFISVIYIVYINERHRPIFYTIYKRGNKEENSFQVIDPFVRRNGGGGKKIY